MGEDRGLSGELWVFVCIASLLLGCVSVFALKGVQKGLEGKERLTVVNACSWGRILVGGEHGEGVGVDSDRFQWDTEGSCRARTGSTRQMEWGTTQTGRYFLSILIIVAS